MKICILGSSGMLGNAVAKEFLNEKKFDVYLSYNNKANYNFDIKDDKIFKFDALDDFEFLKKYNFDVITLPILKVKKTVTKKVDHNQVQSYVCTSLNGIYYLSDLIIDKKKKLFVIGETSSLYAKKQGFKNVIDCDGDSGKLVNVIRKNTLKGDGDIIYAGAKKVSLDVPKKLKSLGYTVNRIVLYETTGVSSLKDIFKKYELDVTNLRMIFLSKKGAEVFISLFLKEYKEKLLSKINFYCLSKNIASVFNSKICKINYPKVPLVNSMLRLIKDSETKNGY